MSVLYEENSNIIEITELTDHSGSTDSAVTTGTVEVTLYDSAAVPVTGETWPLAMTYNATRLAWRAVLTHTLPLVQQADYYAKVRAVAPSGLVLTSYESIRVLRRMS